MNDSRGRSRGKGGWQQGGSGKDRRIRRSDVHAWRKSISGEDNTWRKMARRLRMAAILALCGLCIALLVWLLRFDRFDQTLVTVVVPADHATFNSAVPPRGFAEDDLNALQALYKDHRGDPHVDDDFQALADAVGDNKTLVFYYSGPSTNLDGRDYLLNADTTPDDLFDDAIQSKAAKLHTLDKLWEAARKKNPKQKWIVLLDAAAPDADWRLSLFGRAPLDKLSDKTADIQNLVVIGAAEPGQQSWASPHLGGGRSVFGYYVTQALSNGKASQANDSERDEFITVRELFTDVRSNVDDWVRNNRSPAGQTVFITPDQESAIDDFVVINLGNSSRAAPHNADASPSKRTGHPGWEAFAGTVVPVNPEQQTNSPQIVTIRSPALFDVDPLRWRAWADELLRADQFALADPHSGLQPDSGKPVEDYRESLRTQFLSLQNQPQQAVRLAARIFDRAWPANALTNDSQADAAAAADGQYLPELQLDAAWQTFHKLNGTSWETPELQGVRPAVERANELRKLAETAADSPLGTYHWISWGIVQADSYRRHGEDLLFLGQTSLAENDFRQAESRYQQAQQTARNIAAARRNLHRLWAELPEIARWAAHNESLPADERLNWLRDNYQPTRDVDCRQQQPSERFSRLLACFRETRCLQNQLLSNDVKLNQTRGASTLELMPDTLYELSQQILAASQAAVEHLQDLRREIGETCDNLESTPYTVDDHVRIRDAARYSLMEFSKREELFRIRDDCERETNKQSQNTENDAARTETSADQLRSQQLWQAAWSIEVLGLATPWQADGDQADQDFGPLWKNAVSSPPDSQEFRLLGDAIRHSWSKNREQFLQAGRNTAADISQLLRADQLARTLHGYDVSRLLREADYQDQCRAARRLHEYFLADLYVSQAERFVEDFWAGPQAMTDSGARWYAKASDACLTAAANAGPEAAATNQPRTLPFPKIQKRIDALRSRRESFHWNQTPLTFSVADANPTVPAQSPQAMIRFPDSEGDQTTGQLSVSAHIGPVDALPAGRVVLTAVKSVTDVGTGSSNHPVRDSDFTLTGDRFRSVAVPLEESKSYQWKLAGRSDDDEGDQLVLTSNLFFRGHQKTVEAATIDLAGPQLYLTIHHEALPPDARSGSVQVTGFDQRSIVFVLDCSRSMVRDENNNPIQRFETAKSSLQNIIDSLFQQTQQNNAPFRTGLVVFGVGPNKFGVDTKVELAKLDQTQVGNFTNQFRLLSAEGGTPLTAGIRKGVDLIAAEKPGVDGIVVVITDGAEKLDTVSPARMKAIDEERQNLRTVLETLACPQGALLPRHIEIQLISFETTDKEWQDAIDLKNLLTENPNVSCTATQAANADVLIEALANSVKQRPYFLQLPTETPPRKEALGETQAGLAPRDGNYRVGFPFKEQQNAKADNVCRQETVQPFQIRGGESIVYRLEEGRLVHVPKYDKNKFKPDTTATYAAPTASIPREYGRRLALRELHTDLDRMELALAHFEGNDDSYVQWPQNIEFDVRGYPNPANKDQFVRPTEFIWKLIPGESLPIWAIEKITWPVPVRSAEVDAVWNMEDLAASPAVLKLDALASADPLSIDRYKVDQWKQERRGQQQSVSMVVTVPQASSDENAAHPARLRVRLAAMRNGRFEILDVDQTTRFQEIPGTQSRQHRIEATFTLNSQAGETLYVVLQPVDAAPQEPGVGTATKLDVHN